MLRPALIKTSLVAFGLIVSILIFSSCDAITVAGSLKISGPWDLFYLSVALNNRHSQFPEFPEFKMVPSTASLEGLRKGQYDVVLLGREPALNELEGLQDNVIAYDAVSVIVDENSYTGGQYGNSRKTAGLQGLTTSDLKEIFGNKRWVWNGEYYSRDQQTAGNNGLLENNIGWVKQSRQIQSFFHFLTGKYDTQTVLYQSLGLNESEIAASWKGNYSSQNLNLEEEILSFEYQPGPPYSVDSGDFPFKLGFASRRVTTLALQHVPVRALAINGINPIEKPETIYDGTYPLSRKIHILTEKNPSKKASELVEFLTSIEGQKLILDAGYLPLTKTK